MNMTPIEIRLPLSSLLLVIVLAAAGPVIAKQPAEQEARPAHAAENAPTDPQEEHDLSLSPAPKYPIYPPDRPEWIDQPGIQRDGEHVRMTVVGIPSASPDTSKDALRLQMRLAVQEFARQELKISERVDPKAIDDAWIEQYLIDPARVYSGTLETSDGLMYEDAAQLVFDAPIRADMRRLLRETIVQQRLQAVAVLGGLGVLGCAGMSVLMRGANQIGRRRRHSPVRS